VLDCFLALLSLWRPVFRQERSFCRALRQALGSLTVVGTATLTRILAGLGLDQQDWSAEYRLQSRRDWDEQALFDALLATALAHCGRRFVPVALDDTRRKKTGKRIPLAGYQRDPLSPPFHVNLPWSLRFLQTSVLLPLHRKHNVKARAVPGRFGSAPAAKKPKRNAPAEQKRDYRRQQREHSLSQPALRLLDHWRQSLDQAGAGRKPLLVAGDASFCNRILFRPVRERIELLCRTRSDVRLCWPATDDWRRIYSREKFTPQQVKQNDEIA
jgi:hypothetical protein